jgi:hypothetical protein
MHFNLAALVAPGLVDKVLVDPALTDIPLVDKALTDMLFPEISAKAKPAKLTTIRTSRIFFTVSLPD